MSAEFDHLRTTMTVALGTIVLIWMFGFVVGCAVGAGYLSSR